MPRVDLATGTILICPRRESACRVGSPYWQRTLGKCDRCNVVMHEDVGLARVRHRSNLYEVRD